MTRRLSCLVLAALIGCTAAVDQLSAQDCAAGVAGVPMDVREGVVSWAEGGDRTILDCWTGQAMQLNVTRNSGPLGTRDVTQEVSAWLWSVPELPRLSQLRDGLTAMGVTVSETAFLQETCACAAFYPGLRGSKPKYEWTT